MLNLFYSFYFDDSDYSSPVTLLKYVLYNGQPPKKLALNVMVCFVTMEQIHASDLPQYLFREIMARKTN